MPAAGPAPVTIVDFQVCHDRTRMQNDSSPPTGAPAFDNDSAPTHSVQPDDPGDVAAPTVNRAYVCQCGRPVFLGNTRCLACGTPLGYVIERLGVVPLAVVPTPVRAPARIKSAPDGVPDGGPPNTATVLSERHTVFGDTGGLQYQRCANVLTPSGCNWMVPAPCEGDPPEFNTLGLAPGYCLSCSSTRTIPDLSQPDNDVRWRKLEQAKRRLLSQLLALGLRVVTRHGDPVHGLAFDFLSNLPGGPHVLTGHEMGVITLNAEEADDSVRERIRAEMREPYRTLVGHFRHEIGHYYWDLLLPGSDWLDDFHALFGDETLDYAQALRDHYEKGPPADWPVRFVTSYASSHPWEDWAETWAHYLHMADTADTALSFGIDARHVELAGDLFQMSDLWQPDHPGAEPFLDFLNGWVRLTNVLNELSRSMGQPDYYPFVLPRAAVGKLQFVHQVIRGERRVTESAPASDAPAATAATDASTETPPATVLPAQQQHQNQRLDSGDMPG